MIGGQVDDPRLGAADRGEHREAAGLAEAVGPAYRCRPVGGRHEKQGYKYDRR